METVKYAFLGLLLGVQAAAGSIQPQLPAEVTMNKDAGRGGHLIVTLRLEDGEELPFIVETGAPATVLDKSLEPKLGTCFGTTTIKLPQSNQQKSGMYAAPKLYLGGAPLVTGSNVLTYDFKPRSSPGRRPNMGFLGMDCLKHYCIQLDFEAGKMRFLDPDRVNAAELGKAFPLTISENPKVHHSSLLGRDANLVVDTGCNIDGLFAKSAAVSGEAWLPECVWDGETYTNLLLGVVEHVDALGLGFLARHLVTLDFPNQTMYLKRTTVGPLVSDVPMKKSQLREIREFLLSLKGEGQLPGWSKDDKDAIYFEGHPNASRHPADAKGATYLIKTDSRFVSESATFDFRKSGDSSTCHYGVSRASADSPWKLQKAWRTDRGGRTIEKYPVP